MEILIFTVKYSIEKKKSTVPDLKVFEPGRAGKSSLWIEKSAGGSAGLDTTP